MLLLLRHRCVFERNTRVLSTGCDCYIHVDKWGPKFTQSHITHGPAAALPRTDRRWAGNSEPATVTGPASDGSDKDAGEHFGYRQSRSSDTQMSSQCIRSSRDYVKKVQWLCEGMAAHVRAKWNDPFKYTVACRGMEVYMIWWLVPFQV